MATNKQALIRYKCLDRCLRNFHKRYYIEDLVRECNEALKDYAGGKSGVKKRQIYDDLNDMEDSLLFGVKINRIPDGRRKYFRYYHRDMSIMQSTINDEDMDKLKEALFMLRRFRGLPSYEWVDDFLFHIDYTTNSQSTDEQVIEFESNPYVEGTDYLEPLMNAAINHQCMHIVYQPFGKPEEKWDIHPYYIKQHNGRWFLFGLNDQYKDISCIPLDRIRSIKDIGVTFIPNNDIDFKEEYFADTIGVHIPKNKDIEEVWLQFDYDRFPYIKTKPIHESQTVIDAAEGIVRIKVKPDKELKTLILSYGSQVSVLKPESLKQEIKEEIESMRNNY